jgi:hydroxymethylglutaryl-CoA lyase
MEHIQLFETTPRDGLQNEKFILSKEEKLELITAGRLRVHREIEVGSFVNPKAVPQMAGTGELFRALPAAPDVTYYGLIPNRKGYELALEAGCRHMGYVLAVTETMNMRNVRMSVAESFAQFKEIREMARRDGVRLRATWPWCFTVPSKAPPTRPGPWSGSERWLTWAWKTSAWRIPTATPPPNGPPPARRCPAVTGPAWGTREFLSLHLHNTYGYAARNARLALRKGHPALRLGHGRARRLPVCPGSQGQHRHRRTRADLP